MTDKPEVPTLAQLDPMLQSKIMSALKRLVEQSKIRVGLVARRARNTLQRMQGQEPTPGWDAGVKRWMRYHKKVAAAIPAAPHIHPRHKRAAI